MTGKEKKKMDRFIAELMRRMTLAQKIGQLNNPHSSGADTTGVSAKVDVEERVRRGEVGTTSGETPERRRRLQEIALNESPAGIPLAFAIDVNHGYRTIFPIPLGLSCSWDMGLIEKTARAAAREATTEGISITWTPMVDISRDARWGRVAEGAGEDPYLGARIAEAMVRGLQGDNLSRPDTMMATAKHFAGYGFVEAGRDYNTVDASPYKMHNVVLPPFKAAVDAGAGSIMVAFNDISGVPATAHKEMLDGLLRKKWGYDGLLVTDYTAVEELINHGAAKDLKEAAWLAARTGITTDLVSEAFMLHLEALVKEGRLKEKAVDAACRRVLEAKYRLGLFDDPFRYLDPARGKKVMLSPEHRALAREAAAKSCVLLKNENRALPLRKSAKIALVGPLAGGEEARANMQGTWAVSANPQDSVTVLEGLRGALGADARIIHAKGANIEDDRAVAARLDVHNRANPTASVDARSPEDMIAEALKAAENSDVIVACVGEAKEHSGESSTRSEIGLPASQRRLLEALKKTGKPLVLVTMSGRPLALEWENENADAILHAWFPGTEAGNAIADLLLGDRAPSGKLTMSFPRNAGQCPISYADPPTGRPREKAGIDVYGDTKKGADGLNLFRKFTTACRLEGAHTPLFPFGYGLSYATFDYSPVAVSKTHLRGGKDVLRASVRVRNTGACAAEETVQLYISDPVASMVRPAKELKGFRKIMLAPGEEKEVSFEITPEELKFYKAKSLSDYRHVWEEGEFIIRIGSSSKELQSVRVQWDKAPRRKAGPRRG
jgi:beta-glucosidase